MFWGFLLQALSFRFLSTMDKLSLWCEVGDALVQAAKQMSEGVLGVHSKEKIQTGWVSGFKRNGKIASNEKKISKLRKKVTIKNKKIE